MIKTSGLLLGLCLTMPLAGALPTYTSSVIALSSEKSRWTESVWYDINQDGRDDLFILQSGETSLSLYLQEAQGFPVQATQTIDIPPQTAWIRFCDIDPSPGIEMLLSRPSGLVYLVQAQGRFQHPPQPLLNKQQSFDHNVTPQLADTSDHTNPLVPVMADRHTDFYRIDSQGQCRLEKTVSLETQAKIEQADWPEWSIGHQRSYGLYVTNRVRPPTTEDALEVKLKNNPKLSQVIKKLKQADHYGIHHQDLNADDHNDLVLWQLTSRMPPKTVVMVYMQNQEGQFPEKPTQLLRCQGLPVTRTNGPGSVSVLKDLNQDGHVELVLLAMRSNIVSASSLLDTVLSHGLDWSLTVRPYQPHRGYAKTAPAKIPLTTCPPYKRMAYLLHFNADLNADGRNDLVVHRSNHDYDVYLGATQGYYETSPAFTLHSDVGGSLESSVTLKDLNNDGCADLIVKNYLDYRIEVLLSQRSQGVQP